MDYQRRHDSRGHRYPRLRVCCLLSLARTELFFRQVLGRVLRLQPDQSNHTGWLYCLAEPGLVRYAEQSGAGNTGTASNEQIEHAPSSGGCTIQRYKSQGTSRSASEFAKQSDELLLEGEFMPQAATIKTTPGEELLSVWMQGKFTERVLALIG